MGASDSGTMPADHLYYSWCAALPFTSAIDYGFNVVVVCSLS